MISKRVRCDSISPEGLRDSHILFNQIKGTTLLSECKRIAGGPFGKFGPTCAYGFWTRRFVIAIPAAKTSNNPAQPSQRFRLVRVLLAFGLAFKRRADRFGGRDRVLVGDVSGRSNASVTCVDELNRARSPNERDRSEIEQAMRLSDLRFFDAQSIALHGTEDLLNPPAQPIEPNDVLGGGEFVNLAHNRQCGQKTPSNPVFFRGRVLLVHLHIGEHHRLGIGGRSTIAWLADAHASRLHSYMRDPSAFARTFRRNKNLHGAEFAPIRRRVEQSFFIDEFAVLCSTYNQFHPFRTASELRIDIEFSISDNDYLRGATQQIIRRLRRLDPAYGFLFFDLPRLTIRQFLARSRPDFRMHDAEQRLVIGINRNHRMAEEPLRLAIAGWPQALALVITAAEVDLGGVVRRDDPSPCAGLCGSSGGRREYLVGGHMRRIQKTTCRQFSSPVASDHAQHQRTGGYHLLKHPRPRRSTTRISEISDKVVAINNIHGWLPANQPASNHNDSTVARTKYSHVDS